MTAYIFYKDNSKIPKRKRVLSFIYSSEFINRIGTGMDVENKKGELRAACYIWSKWKENPECPHYMYSAPIWIGFSPFDRRRGDRYSKVILSNAKKLNYSNVAQVYIGNAQHQLYRKPAVADHRAFHRCVYFYARETNGLIYNSASRKILTPEEYHEKYKQLIRMPFRKKLKPIDMIRMKPGETEIPRVIKNENG